MWPCRLKIIATFCKRDPIILGVDIVDGTLRVGTPLAVVKIDPVTGKKDIIDLGKMSVHLLLYGASDPVFYRTSLEINHKNQDVRNWLGNKHFEIDCSLDCQKITSWRRCSGQD